MCGCGAICWSAGCGPVAIPQCFTGHLWRAHWSLFLVVLFLFLTHNMSLDTECSPICIDVAQMCLWSHPGNSWLIKSQSLSFVFMFLKINLKLCVCVQYRASGRSLRRCVRSLSSPLSPVPECHYTWEINYSLSFVDESSLFGLVAC